MGQTTMQRLDRRAIPEGAGEIRLFAVMRDERLRLASWLRHYRALGVHRFFVVDNGSSDGTVEDLLEQPDVHLFSTREDFQLGQSGRRWIAWLLEQFGIGRWCVVADADELLAFPDWERTSLTTLAARLTAAGDEALPCVLLDMYSDRAIAHTHLQPGANLFELCPWFDAEIRAFEGSIDDGQQRIPIPTLVGGIRQRVFHLNAYLSKIGMLHYRPGLSLTRGQHGVLGARVSAMRGVMFHFKFLSDIIAKAQAVITNGERGNCSEEWQAYHQAFTRSPQLCLQDAASIRLIDSSQLLALGLMRTDARVERCSDAHA